MTLLSTAPQRPSQLKVRFRFEVINPARALVSWLSEGSLLLAAGLLVVPVVPPLVANPVA